jgi:hypothetical protein
MLELNTPYPIERFDEAGEERGSVYVFVFGRGLYDGYRIEFVLFDDRQQANYYFEELDPNVMEGFEPIAFFKASKIKPLVPVETVTRLGFEE